MHDHPRHTGAAPPPPPGSPTSAWRPRRCTVGRISTMVVGGLALVLSLTLLLVGGSLLTQQGQDGVDLGSGVYDGPGHAIVSAPLDWSTESYLGAPIDRTRFEVTATDEHASLFIGLTTSDEAQKYLGGRSDSVDDGHRFEYAEHVGSPPEQDPRDLDIWTAQADGDGTATLEFSTEEQRGEHVLVIMDVEGNPLAAPEITSVGEAPGVSTLAVALTAAGGLGAVAGLVLIVLPLRRALSRSRQEGRR